MPGGDSVKVAVRVRPFNQRELGVRSECAVSMVGCTTILSHPVTGEQRAFSFDHSYWSHDGFREEKAGSEEGVAYVPESDHSPYASQSQVFEDLGRGVLSNAWQGYNAALFAYGQTGSGKSYSMIGSGANKGIVPLTCQQLFSAIEQSKDPEKQFQVTFSMLEIYNENVLDLLTSVKNQPRSGLRVRRHPTQGFYVEGLKRVPVESYATLEGIMNKGTIQRTTASTTMNATSSRSHMVITVIFKQIYKDAAGQSRTMSSEIRLVDLAGSERAGALGATGDRLREGSNINKSLSTLGKVISALSDLASGKTKVIVPYRDSVLTTLLQSTLGGNSRTLMIAALSPAAGCYEETLSTLRYADRAKKIQNQAVVNENPTEKLIRELKQENARLLAELRELAVGGQLSDSSDLKDIVTENSRQMEELQLSWQQRLEVAKADWERSTQPDSKSHSGTSWQELPYLRNINEDPQLSGVIKLTLDEGTTLIGLPGHGADIEIRGLGIKDKHATIESRQNKCVLAQAKTGAEIAINGKYIIYPTELVHLDRVKMGSSCLYLYIGHPCDRAEQDNLLHYDYDFCQAELASGSTVGRSVFRSLSHDTSPADGDDVMSTLVFHEYVNVLPKVYDVNLMSRDMAKGVSFKAEVENLATHDALGRPKQKDVIVRVTDEKNNKVWIWSKDKFINRKFMIEDMYYRWQDKQSIVVEQVRDPFWDPVEDIYLGCGHMWLASLGHRLTSSDQLDLCNHQGQIEARLHITLVPCDPDGSVLQDEDALYDPNMLVGQRLDFKVILPQCMENRWITSDRSRGVYCGFNFFEYPRFIKTSVVCGSVNATFAFQKQFTIMKVTEDLLDYMTSHALVIELWGTQVPDDEEMLNMGTPRRNVPNTKPEKVQAKLRLRKISLSPLKKNKRKKEESRESSHVAESPRHRRTSVVLIEGDINILRDKASTSINNEKDDSAKTKPNGPNPGHSMDADIAKALKVFFKDVKKVQSKLKEATETGRSQPDINAARQRAVFDEHMQQLDEAGNQLDTCVGSLRASMLSSIQRMKAEVAKNERV